MATDLQKMVEAALFMSPTPLHLNDFRKIVRVYNDEEIQKAINYVQKEYDEKDSSIKIIETMNGWQMAVRDPYEEKVVHLAASADFNKSVLRTLAFIAYKEPLKQSTLIKFRNNKAYDHIKLLETKGFIERKEQGQTFIIQTTPKFRRYFGDDAVKLKKMTTEDKKERQEAKQETLPIEKE